MNELTDQELDDVWYWIHMESANYGEIRDRFKQVVRAIYAGEPLPKRGNQ